MLAMTVGAVEFAYGPFQYEIMTEATSSTPGTARCIGLSDNGRSMTSFASTIFPEVNYNGKQYYVTEVKNYAFRNVTNMVSVDIGYGIKTLGFAAFGYCTSLRSVSIPSSVDFSFNGIFAGCSNLRIVRLAAPTPPSVMSSVFPENSGMELHVPNGLADVQAYKNNSSFSRFSKILSSNEAYDIEDELGTRYVATKQPVAGVGELTITGYTGYEDDVKEYVPTYNSIMIQGKQMRITQVGTAAFDGTALEKIDLSGLTYLKVLNKEAIFDNDNLTTLILNDGLETICGAALCNSTSLTSLNIPRSVKKIDEYGVCSFIDGCYNLSQITVDPANTVFAAYNNMLFSKDMLVLWRCPEGWKNQPWEIPGKVLLPEVTYEVAEAAFSHCANIVDIRLPYNVEMLYSNTFSSCPNLEIVRLPSSLNYGIGTRAFEYCPKLKTITMAASSPTELLDHDETNSILYGCGDVTLYVSRANNNAVADYTAANGYDIFAKIEQSGEANDYQSAVGHQYVVNTPYDEDTDTKGKLTLVGFIPTMYTHYSLESSWLDPNSPKPDRLFDPNKYEVFIVAKEACKGLKNLQNVIIPATVRTIGISAFEGSSVSGSINLPPSVLLVREKAFYDCPNLKEIFGERSSAPLIHTNAFGNNASDFTFYVPWNGYKSYANRVNDWTVSDEEKEAAKKQMSSYIDRNTGALRLYDSHLFSFGHPVDLTASGLTSTYAVTGYNSSTKSVKLEAIGKVKENAGVLVTNLTQHTYRMKRIELDEDEVSGNLLIGNEDNALIPANGLNYTFSPANREFNKMTEASYPTVYLAMPNDTFPSIMPIDPSEGVYGDVNGDGSVDIDDINAIINISLGLSKNYIDGADVNGDGSIDIDDINIIINLVINY